jgi:CRISPR-associated protein Csd1
MILRRLYELAERERLLDDPAFEEVPVPWIVKLGPAGEYLGIEDRRGVVTIPAKRKGAPAKTKPDKGKPLSIPRAHGNTANPGFARCFVDTLARMLPVSDEPKSVRSRDTFWGQIHQATSATNDPALQAVVAFGRQLQSQRGLKDRVCSDIAALKPAAGDRCAFAWDPDMGRTVVERENVREWFRGFYNSRMREREESGVNGVCQVTGDVCPLPSSHAGKLAGVPGGIAAGVSLISYDKAAFESYGLEGTANAGVGYRAADAYLRALGALTQEKLPGRPRSRLRIGNVLFLFWTRDAVSCDDIMQLEQPDSADVARLIESADRGAIRYANDENQFYCLVLSGNAARAVVRDYLESPLPDVRSNLGRWFRDLQVVDDSYEQQGRVHSCFPLWMLAAATAREMDDVPSEVFSQLMEGALKGYPMPDSTLAACLHRIRAETGPARFRAPQMALIRLCLNRTHCKGDRRMSESLDHGRAHDDAYVCGRLLAFVARCQSPQDFGASAQILERYFGSASTSPQSVFPTLLRLNRHHINKVRDENPGFAFNLEAELDELLLPLKTTGSGAPDFPAILSLPQQGRFALGFYHQRAEYRRQSAERKLQAGDR